MRLALVAAVLLASKSQAAEMPRLTATLIGPDARTALFAEPGGTIPVTVGEHIGDYTVDDIEPGRVGLDKAGRRIVVSVAAAASAVVPRDPGNVTMGLMLRQQIGPADQ